MKRKLSSNHHYKRLLIPFLMAGFLIASFALVLGQAQSAAPVAEAIELQESYKSEIEATTAFTIPDDYNTGLWPTIPPEYTEYESESYTPLVLIGEPEVTMTDEWIAELSFTTAISVPAVTVYYGVYDPNALLPWPHFVHIARGQVDQNGTQHQVTLNHLNLTTEMEEQGGGVIVYRIEAYNPDAVPTLVVESTARFYDKRFEFYHGQVVPTVSKGPFVDQVTENSAIISWETDQLVDGIVKVEGIGDFPSSNSNASHFEVDISGLTSGTTYTYTVSVTDGLTTTTTRQYAFRTAAEDTTQFTFAVLGDSRSGFGGGERDVNGVNHLTLRSLSSQAFKRGAQFIVHTGNLVNGYTPSELNFAMQIDSFKNAVEHVGHYIPIYEVMGNHEAVIDQYSNAEDDLLWLDKEGIGSAEAIFGNQFVNPTNGPTADNDAAGTPPGQSLPPYSENTYYFDYGNSRFVVMNTNYWWSNQPEQYGGNLEGYVLDDQMAWLNEVFSVTAGDDSIDHLFLFAHEPMFPNDSHTSDGMWYNGGDPALNGGWDRTYIVERRDEIWRAFVGTGKAVAANFGDEHNYSRTQVTQDKDGNDFEAPAWQIISGGAGASVDLELKTDLPWSDNVEKFSTQLHHTLLRVDGQEVRLEVVSIDDQLIESVILKEHDGTISPNAPTVEPIESTSSLAADFESMAKPLSVSDIQATVNLTIPNGYQTGQWVTPPVPTYTLYNDLEGYIWLLMEDEPEVMMSDQWTANISFTTTIATPAVTVYYGVYDPDALLPWPHYLRSTKEELVGLSRQHQVTLNNLNFTSEMEEQGGGQIVYRIEIYNPNARRVEQYEGKAIMRTYDERFEFVNGQVVPTVSEGPFVDQVTENSAIISWETDEPVMTGSVQVVGLGDFTSDSSGSHFEIDITGLIPGTTYTYTVSVGDGMNTTTTRHYSFRTPAFETTEFTFAVMGDSRLSPGGGDRGLNGANGLALKYLTRDAFNQEADFIVHTGDLVSGYTPSVANFESQLASFKDAMERVGHYIPIYELMGNHEVLIDSYINFNDTSEIFWLDKQGDESTETIFGNAFVNPTNGPTPDNEAANVPEGESLPPYSENVYYFDYGNSRFVMMNNNYWWSGGPELYGGNLEGYVLDDQMAWLTQVFNETEADDTIEHLFLFAQEPMFPNSTNHTGDGMWYNNGTSNYPLSNTDFPQLWDRSYIVERRDQIWRAFVGTGKAVAGNFGDEHSYSRTLITQDRDGNNFEAPVWQLVSGGAGAPIHFEQSTEVPWYDDVKKYRTDFHYTLFKIDGGSVILEVYNIDGELIDDVNLMILPSDNPSALTLSRSSSTNPSSLWQWPMAGLALTILAGILITRRQRRISPRK